MDMFPTVDVEARVSDYWDMVAGFIPVPKRAIVCPQCGWPVPHLSRMIWHHRESSALDRCDVSFKCTRCSMYWTHGIPVSTAAVAAAKEHFGVPEAQWREVRDTLQHIGILG